MSQASDTVERTLHYIHCSESDHNVIFLDVDGVIANTENHLKKAAAKFQANKVVHETGVFVPTSLREADMFVPSCLCALKDLVTIMDAKVVISSAWRKLGETLQIALLKLTEYEIPVIGVTPSLRSGRRDDEIMDYIKQHRIKLSNVLVLDDSEADLTAVHQRLFKVDLKYGLRKTDIPKALAVFCGKESSRPIGRKMFIDMIERLSACDRMIQSKKIGSRGSAESITMARCIAIALSTYLSTSRDSRDSSKCQPQLSYRNWSNVFELYWFEK